MGIYQTMPGDARRAPLWSAIPAWRRKGTTMAKMEKKKPAQDKIKVPKVKVQKPAKTAHRPKP